MKPLILFLTICSLSFSLKAQSDVDVSNIHATYSDFSGYPQGHPLNDSTLVELSLTVHNPAHIHNMQLKMGTASGHGDLLTRNITYFTKNGKEYLSVGGEWHEIQMGTVKFSFVIPKSTTMRSQYVSISGKDKQGKGISKGQQVR